MQKSTQCSILRNRSSSNCFNLYFSHNPIFFIGLCIYPRVHWKYIQAFLRATKSPCNSVSFNSRALKSLNVNACSVRSDTLLYFPILIFRKKSQKNRTNTNERTKKSVEQKFSRSGLTPDIPSLSHRVPRQCHDLPLDGVLESLRLTTTVPAPRTHHSRHTHYVP